MTRADVTQTFRNWWPIVALLGSGLVAWTTLKRDVAESVRTPRFEAESIRVHHDLDDHQREIQAMQRQQQTIDAICRAVRCGAPR